MHPYAPLPKITPRAQDEPLLLYAARVLRFVVEHNVTATLSDIDLELADHVYPLAVSAADLTDATRQRLTDTRTEILATIARRRRILGIPIDAPSVPHDQIPPAEGGHKVKVIPTPITRPPAGQHADF